MNSNENSTVLKEFCSRYSTGHYGFKIMVSVMMHICRLLLILWGRAKLEPLNAEPH
jgi:hypothetical protein